MTKNEARKLAMGILVMLNQSSVDAEDLEAAIIDAKGLAEALEEAAEAAYTEDGELKEGWTFD